MTPRPRAAALLGAAAASAFVVPWPLAVLAALAITAAMAVDALLVRAAPDVARRVPRILARGVPALLTIEADTPRSLRIRQPVAPDVRVEPQEHETRLDAEVTGLRRGRHVLPAPATRSVGPLGLGAWHHRPGEDAELVVYPDLPAARRLVVAVRQGHFRQEGRARGPYGIGTEFESVREYLPDDDIRQVNWRATARLGTPMSNQFRVERDRDVICVVDTGRLTAAPLGEKTRLDVAVDAAIAIAAVADDLGDRAGAIAFDSEVRRSLPPRRRGARAVLQALYDLEPRAVDSDYARGFAEVGGAKRAFVLVFTDLLEEAAARPLVDAVPVLAARHAVVIASVADPDLAELVATEPSRPLDVYRAAVAVDVLEARRRVVVNLRRAGAQVVEAAPDELGAACVRAYLHAKARARV